MMLALTILGGGLAFWMKLSGEAAAPAPVATEPVVVLGPSMRAPVSPGPLVGDGALSAVEVGEIQDLLRLLDFRSEEHTSELQSLMRISYAVFCFKKQNH